MGHPDGAGPVARARESHQLGSGAFHSLAEDSSLQAATPFPPPPIATNLRLICLPVRRYFKNLFVLISRKDIILGVIVREASILYASMLFLTSLLEAIY